MIIIAISYLILHQEPSSKFVHASFWQGKNILNGNTEKMSTISKGYLEPYHTSLTEDHSSCTSAKYSEKVIFLPPFWFNLNYVYTFNDIAKPVA